MHEKTETKIRRVFEFFGRRRARNHHLLFIEYGSNHVFYVEEYGYPRIGEARFEHTLDRILGEELTKEEDLDLDFENKLIALYKACKVAEESLYIARRITGEIRISRDDEYRASLEESIQFTKDFYFRFLENKLQDINKDLCKLEDVISKLNSAFENEDFGE